MPTADFLSWFTQWKDVITIIVALCAILVVVAQIGQASRYEGKRIRREQVAARATLPLTLAALSDYGHEMITALLPLEAWLERRSEGEPPTFVGPRLPPETVASVEKMIAAYPDEHVAKALASLMSEVQILQTRSRDYGKSSESIRSWSIAMKDNIVMAADVIARCQDLFDFAREGTDYADPSKQHIQQVLSLSKVYQHSFPRVWHSTERYADTTATCAAKESKRPLPGLFDPPK